MSENLNKKQLDDAAKAMVAQKDQKEKISKNIKVTEEYMADLTKLNDKNLSALDNLLAQAESLIDSSMEMTEEDITLGEAKTTLTAAELDQIDKEMEAYQIKQMETIESEDWEEYWLGVISYAEKYDLDLNSDPFNQLMSVEQQQAIKQNMKEEYTLEKPQCDKYDYLLAGVSGLFTGLIDVFLVGSPNSEKYLSKQTDEFAVKTVEKFADMLIGRDPAFKGKKKPQHLQAKIQYLEMKYKVPYDAISGKQIGQTPKVLRMNTKNHHMISLAHYPDPIGLIFSIIDQFTESGSYLSNGNFIRGSYETKTPFELRGNTFLEKIFFGFVNWFGHLMSDMVGSNTTVARGGRGTGLPLPFTQFFQMFNNVRFRNIEDDLAKIARVAFEKGYDFRHGVVMSIPVVLNELIIRFLWMVKQYYYHEKNLSSILKERKSPELRRMLLVGHGTLCLVDGVDAYVRSVGDIYSMLLKMNIVAWTRFAYAGFNEVRAIYNENVINRKQRDIDMDREWKELLEGANL